MKSDFLVAVTQLAAERNLPREIVLSAIEAALASAYRKDSVAAGQNITVTLEPGTGEVRVDILKTVMDEVSDDQQEILLADARKIKPDAEVGDTVTTESIPHIAGRIAAQTAKQVVMQRLREAERELVFEEFSDKEGEVFSVNIQRVEPRQLVVDIGRAEAVLPISEQVPFERYRPGQKKMKVLLKSVQKAGKGPELIVSRADTLFVKRLFEMEVPEIFNGAVEIVAIAREPGSRSKVAVRAKQDGVDPVGSCVGLRGVRIQNIVNELMGEKIDVVEWSKDTSKFVANALNPSQVMRVDLDDETQSAYAVVPERQLSLAIGREGQNARLAARLTGWNVDIRSHMDAESAAEKAKAESPLSVEELLVAGLEHLGLSTRTLNVLANGGIGKVSEVLSMTQAELLEIKSFGEKSYVELQDRLGVLKLLPSAAVIEVEQEVPEVSAPVAEAVEQITEEPVEVEAVVAAEATAASEIAEIDIVEEAEAVVEEATEIEAEPSVGDEPATELLPDEQLEALLAADGAEIESAPSPSDDREAAVPVGERTGSLRDVPDAVWSLRRAPSIAEPGVIRFAEDIAGLRGGVTARRGRGGGDDQRGRGRKSKARRKRR